MLDKNFPSFFAFEQQWRWYFCSFLVATFVRNTRAMKKNIWNEKARLTRYKFIWQNFTGNVTIFVNISSTMSVCIYTMIRQRKSFYKQVNICFEFDCNVSPSFWFPQNLWPASLKKSSDFKRACFRLGSKVPLVALTPKNIQMNENRRANIGQAGP